MMSLHACLAAAAGALTLLNPALATADEADSHKPADVVELFNQAVTERDLDRMLAQFADGGVQFNLRPSHGGLQAGPLTQELAARWRTIGPVLFNATSAYTREVNVDDVHVAGDIATVWADVSTTTVLANNDKTTSESFTEVYLLVHQSSGWRIAGIADNRQPDDIGLGGD